MRGAHQALKERAGCPAMKVTHRCGIRGNDSPGYPGGTLLFVLGGTVDETLMFRQSFLTAIRRFAHLTTGSFSATLFANTSMQGAANTAVHRINTTTSPLYRMHSSHNDCHFAEQ